MTLPATGYFNINWPSISGADNYVVRINKNNLFWNSFNTESNSLFLSGFQEGDSIGGIAYPSANDNIYPTGIILQEQTLPVLNFHDEGKTFSFNSISVDGLEVNLINTSSGTFGTGAYQDGSSTIKYSLLNPRTNSSMEGFFSEPFLSGVKYIASSDSLSLERDILNFDFGFNNNLNSRDFDLQIIANDIYGSGTTGHIKMTNEPIAITSCSQSIATQSSSVNGSFELLPRYNSIPSKVDFLLTDTSNGQILNSGTSNFPFLVTGAFPLGKTGSLSLTPYDWYGSGVQFTGLSHLFSYGTYDTVKLNTITDFSLEQYEDQFVFFSDYQSNHNSGSFFEISIDSSSGSFNQDSYLTGRFDDLSSGLSFNFFDQRTGVHEDFSFNVNLYKSGSSTLEDSISLTGSSPLPHFQNTGISFDYGSGFAIINFSSFPQYTFSGVDVMISGNQDSAFSLYSGDYISIKSPNPKFQAKLINSDPNKNIVYDEFFISGSAEIPSIEASINDVEFLDAKNLFNFNNLDPSIEVSSLNIYRSPGFVIGTGIFNESFSGLSEFVDYENHLHLTTNFQPLVDQAPLGLPRQLEYQHSTTGFSFLSGRSFFYMFEPIGAFGTGNAVGPIVDTFTQNVIGGNTESDLSSAEDTVTVVVDSVSTIENSVSTLETSVSSVENSITIIESNINEINSTSLRLTGQQFASGDKSFVDNINIMGNLNVSGATRINNNFIPYASDAPGQVGQMSFDESYFYICTGQDAWGRLAFDEWCADCLYGPNDPPAYWGVYNVSSIEIESQCPCLYTVQYYDNNMTGIISGVSENNLS